MNCPVDNEVLQMSERQGVEVDYCPKCRGVWLDRGELDKVIERASAELAPAGPSGRDSDDRRDRDDRSSRRDDDSYRGAPKKKKRSFLSEVFEFGE